VRPGDHTHASARAELLGLTLPVAGWWERLRRGPAVPRERLGGTAEALARAMACCSCGHLERDDVRGKAAMAGQPNASGLLLVVGRCGASGGCAVVEVCDGGPVGLTIAGTPVPAACASVGLEADRGCPVGRFGAVEGG
jgi:hypothetical protein